MSAVSLITSLAEQDIRLWLEDGNLRYSAPEGAMTPEIIAQLKQSKQEVIDFLQASENNQMIDLPIANRDQPLAVSHAQQRLWFLHKLEPENTAYHIHAALKVEGKLNLEHLNRACSEIIQRHEILRTHYQQQAGKLIQVINEASEWQITPETITADTLDAAITEELHKPFDLGNNEIFRTRLWQLDNQHHMLAFTIHHIAADGWSLGIFVNELVMLYEAFAKGEPSQLPPLERQYADYAMWQAQEEHKQSLQKQMAYWQQQLQGTQNLSLPLDNPRSIYTDNAGAFVDRELGADTTKRLKTFNQQAGTTTFISMMAALSALLHRYSHQNDFCIGTPVAGRPISQLEPLIGCFLNLLAIRCEPESEQSFSDFLQTIKNTCTEAFANQDLPFEQIVNDVVKDRDLAITPLFQVLLSVQNTPFNQTTELSQLHIIPYEATEPAAQFDLKLTVQELENNIQLRFEYKKALFNNSTIERLASHFITLLNEVLNNPQLTLHEINLFGNQQTSETLGLQANGFNDTQAELPANLLLHRLFEQQAEKTPDAIAVSDKETSLTYQQLNIRANQLAQQLISLGQEPGNLVGVCLYRSVNMSVALLGILKAGCAYVPFDPEFPADRLAFMAEDTDISTVISSRQTRDTVDAISGCGLVIDDIDLGSFNQSNLAIEQANDSLFNVIYTSGSTGKPKGVMVPHQGIANRLLWMQKAYPLTANDTVLQKTPYSFDVSVWELFWPLICGSRYYFADPETHKDPMAMRDMIIEKNVTTMHFVPSMLGSFLNTHNIEACSSLRQVFCSGEALQLEHESQFYKKLPQASLHNLYGPTEASIDVSYYDCQKINPFSSVPIGKPIDNIQLHILDEHLKPAPVGIAGELYIGGIGLAKGYLNRSELTANTFIDNPFGNAGHPSNKLYKTGDLARMTEAGEIIYLGRLDHQVKVRGNRIELGEIETALLHHGDIRDAVVVAYQHNNDCRLVAFYLADSEHEPQALISHLSRFLPQSMIPASFMRLDAWPLTPSGKVNRNKLPAPDFSQLNRAPYIAPETGTEKALVTIWQDILDIDKIGINDNFFELGGHSLTATQVLATAQEQFEVEIPVRKIFENPSIKPIAALIDEIVLEQSVFSNDMADDEDSDSFIL